ncbi:MAG TPA: helix-turn-helix domain-containing protein [Ruminiclostridium sp.]
MKKGFKHDVFFKFLIPYIIILLIPIALGMFAYKKTIESVEDGIRLQNLAILQQSKDTLDMRMREVNSVIERLTLDKNVLTMMTVKNPLVQKDTVYTVREIQEQISLYKVTNNFIRTFFIHFSYNDIIISPDDIFLNIENFYGDFFKYNNMDYSSWRSEMLNKYHQREYLPAVPVMLKDQTSTQSQPMIACIQSISKYGSMLNKGTVIMLINESNILKSLEQLNISDGGWAYVVDDKNRLIASTSDHRSTSIIKDGFNSDKGMMEDVIDNENMMVYYCKSSYNGWKYVAVLPKSVVMSKVNYAKQLLEGFLIISLLSGIFIAYFMAYRNSKPIREIIRNLHNIMGNEKNQAKNSFMYMKNSVASLIANNENMQEKMQKQLPLLQVTLLNKILNGEFIGHSDAEAYFEQMGIMMRGSWYLGVLIRINSFPGGIHQGEYLDNINAMKVILKEALTDYGEEMLYPHDVDFDKLLVIINFSNEEKDDYGQKAEMIAAKVKETLSEKYGMRLTFAAGNPVEGITNIAQTFSEAKSALECKTDQKAGLIIWYSKVPKESKGYYYPVDIEMRFMNFAKAGDKDEIKQLMNSVYKENYEERKLSAYMLKHLINNMSCTVIKLLDTIFYGEDESTSLMREGSNRLESCATAEEFFNSILEIYLSICDTIHAKKKSNNVNLKERILAYLNNNFTDPQISLTSVAVKYGLAEAYLSQFFKEQAGENFSTYIEKLRIRYAGNLLRASDITIEDVSEKSGYNSAHVFRSAFKRIEGITPTVYRGNITKVK